MSGLTTSVSLFAVLFSVMLDDALTVFAIVPFTLAVNHTVKLALSPAAKTPSYLKTSPVKFQRFLLSKSTRVNLAES